AVKDNSALEESAAADFGSKDPASYHATIELMAHSMQLEGMVNRFMEKYPGIEVNWTIIPGSEHLNQIMTRVSSGDLPDVFTSKTEFIRYINNVPDCFANLSEAPYRGEEIASKIVPYVADLSRDLDGNLRSISWQTTVGGLYYRRSIAKEAFGTDDPDDISALVSDWDKFEAAAAELKNKTGDKYSMLARYDTLYHPFSTSREKGWVDENGKLFVDENVMHQYFDLAKRMWDNGYLARTQDDTQFIGTMQNSNVFMYILPTWGLNFQIMPNAPDTAGDWGLARAPQNYFWGGTWLGIGYNTDIPEEAYMLLEYMLTDEDNIMEYAKSDGDYVSNLAVQQKMGGLPEADVSTIPAFNFMGNQNIYSIYNDMLQNGIPSELITEYDDQMQKLIILACTAYVEEGKTFEEAIQQFKDEALTFAPELG
ncbi:MAG: ABC transporter substrate-binding protein, partial [Acetanaerobacterium sp.]